MSLHPCVVLWNVQGSSHILFWFSPYEQRCIIIYLFILILVMRGDCSGLPKAMGSPILSYLAPGGALVPMATTPSYGSCSRYGSLLLHLLPSPRSNPSPRNCYSSLCPLFLHHPSCPVLPLPRPSLLCHPVISLNAVGRMAATPQCWGSALLLQAQRKYWAFLGATNVLYGQLLTTGFRNGPVVSSRVESPLFINSIQ